MKSFWWVWLGELVSKVGSGLTQFAIGVWVYQVTGSATLFALILFATSFPGLLSSPFIGVWVDRWDRRKVLIFSNSLSLVSTASIATLVLYEHLDIWMLYPVLALSSIAEAFIIPALTASATLMVEKKDFGRANGLIQLCQAGELVLSPLLAGLLLEFVGLGGVILIDVGTFLFAIITLSLIRIPRPKKSESDTATTSSVRAEVREGWSYLVRHRGLTLQLFFSAAINFLLGVFQVLLGPLLLSFASAATFGMVVSISGVGMLVGAIILGSWGGPKRRIKGVLYFSFSLCAGIVLCGVYSDWIVIAVGGVIVFMSGPFINGCSQAIWQAKIPSQVQGRVFALRRMLTAFTVPLAFLLAGPLADYVFEPLLVSDGALAGTVGALIGTGPGRGIGLIYILLGSLGAVFTLMALLSPDLRNVEDDVPDAEHVEDGAAAEDI